MFVGVLIIAGIYYAIIGRHVYTGPVALVSTACLVTLSETPADMSSRSNVMSRIAKPAGRVHFSYVNI